MLIRAHCLEDKWLGEKVIYDASGIIKGLHIAGVRQDQQRHNAVTRRRETSYQLVEDPSMEPEEPDAQSPERLSRPEQGADP